MSEVPLYSLGLPGDGVFGDWALGFGGLGVDVRGSGFEVSATGEGDFIPPGI